MDGIARTVEEHMPLPSPYGAVQGALEVPRPEPLLTTELREFKQIILESLREDRIETLKLIAGIRDDMREIRKEIRGLRTRRARRPKKP